MRVDFKKYLASRIDAVLIGMAEFDRYSDDEDVKTADMLEDFDAVIEHHGNIIRYGVYIGTRTAFGVEMVDGVASDAVFMWSAGDDMPMRTIFETEGAKWREMMTKGLA